MRRACGGALLFLYVCAASLMLLLDGMQTQRVCGVAVVAIAVHLGAARHATRTEGGLDQFLG
jgi:hypothetical protein